MCQPEGFSDGTDKVAKLLMGLYSIKQGAYLWNKHMHQKLTLSNFVHINADYAVYTHHSKKGTSITAIHIDNALTVTDTKAMLKQTRKLLHSLFEMKKEDPDWLMGIKLTDDRENGTINLSQAQYINMLLRHHRMDTCTPISTPMEKDVVLSKADCPQDDTKKQEMVQFPYCKVLGGITWLSVVMCPDLAYAVSQLGQFRANPGKKHWNALLRVLRYIQGTRDLALTLGRVSNADPDVLTGYMDASWARNPDNYSSVSGYVFKLGDAAILWSSKKQSSVAASSTEAEYMAMAHSTKQVWWLHYLLINIGRLEKCAPPTSILVDNTGAITLTKEACFHPRTRHIGVQYLFSLQQVKKGRITFMHVPTAECSPTASRSLSRTTES